MPQPSQAFSLSQGTRSASPLDAPPFEAAYTDRLWLAVHLPHLVIEAVAVADPGAARHPQVVIESRRGRAEIVAASPAARRLGIRAGATLGAARAVARALEVLDRSPPAERERLETLAVWCQGLTSQRTLEPPDGLLLEIGGSLRLFGGVEPLKVRVADELERRGLSGRLSAAPTPLGALWLARAGGGDALAPDGLRGRLGALSFGVTAWPEETRRLLAEMGIATLGECMRLPRASFARRVGRACLEDLDRALGKRPDPRAAFGTPLRYERCLELPVETRDAAMLVEAIRRLLDSFGAYLRARQLQTQRVEIVLHHRDGAPTVHAHEAVKPVHRAERLLEFLALGLERLALPSPCIAVELRAAALEPVRLDTPDLFARGEGRVDVDESSAALIESLRARLGAGEVHRLALVADHRPERVWTRVDTVAARLDAGPVSPWIRRRPLWLLPKPLPLERALARFHFARPLVFETGPERIEAGWWDGDDVRRDYFIAATPNGERLWAYRDHPTTHWYLHGIFA